MLGLLEIWKGKALESEDWKGRFWVWIGQAGIFEVKRILLFFLLFIRKYSKVLKHQSSANIISTNKRATN